MRDRADNCVVVCSIENFDPMGVHTGDSITVAPAQTLSDVEYQAMRDDAFACIRRVGVETGGSNIQFAVDPTDGRRLVIEMNPRVSRSSALASKATGFPIAKIAARLAVGYTLDEITNDITGATPASFEPTIDYVVTKIPRWAFEKLPGVVDRLGTRMQSVGEVMAIGRTFPESLQKAIRSLEQGRAGLNADPAEAAYDLLDDDELVARACQPTPGAGLPAGGGAAPGHHPDALAAATGVDPWFLDQLAIITEARRALRPWAPRVGRARRARPARRGARSSAGFLRRPDRLPAVGRPRRSAPREGRHGHRDRGPRRAVWPPGCGPRSRPSTPAAPSSRPAPRTTTPPTRTRTRCSRASRPRVVILGSGPNRIGQGIEFDYCCVHASMALRAAGYETVMVNCNPETVSTDYDTSDRLYFEPLTAEDVANVLDAEIGGRAGPGGAPVAGVIVSLGRPDAAQAGPRPSTRAGPRAPARRPSTWPRTASDGTRLCEQLGIPQPAGGTAITVDEALAVAQRRSATRCSSAPATCSGGGPWRSSTTTSAWRRSSATLGGLPGPRRAAYRHERPVLVDRFLEDADRGRRRRGAGPAPARCSIAGVMEHVEEAGVHSGDSACALPPQTLVRGGDGRRSSATPGPSPRPLSVVGLLNVQYAVKEGMVYVLEANPRASRTVPFVAKATGVPVAMVAARVMTGSTLARAAGRGPAAARRPAAGG